MLIYLVPSRLLQIRGIAAELRPFLISEAALRNMRRVSDLGDFTLRPPELLSNQQWDRLIEAIGEGGPGTTEAAGEALDVDPVVVGAIRMR